MMLLEIGNGTGVDVDYHRTWKYSLALHLYKACIWTTFLGIMSVAHWEHAERWIWRRYFCGNNG